MRKSRIRLFLKSFYASVECTDRGLDPLNTNLVVADSERTEKTICLAVSPSLKAYGIPGRARLFEVIAQVRKVNQQRLYACPGHTLKGESYLDSELKRDASLALSYIVAIPRMQLYMDVSTKVYKIYLKYIAPEDIHVYSIDEVFIDATRYLALYGMTARELAMTMIRDVLASTGITATAGIGSNLYLCKIAMDITAKKMKADRDGVRIAELDEQSYRRNLWEHRPITDFWRVGKGYAAKLEKNDMFTMGDIALRSTYDEECLYRLFGINAELLIDHAWGYEPVSMQDIRSYIPESSSYSTGQVLKCAYSYDKCRVVVAEMCDSLVLDLISKRLVTSQMILNVGYDVACISDERIRSAYKGDVIKDSYGRSIPKAARGSVNLEKYTSSAKSITEAVLSIYDRIVDRNLLIRRVYVVANLTVHEDNVPNDMPVQLDLFTDYETVRARAEKEKEEKQRERKRQEAILYIRSRYGKNAILKGVSYTEGATAKERNKQIGGHKA